PSDLQLETDVEEEIGLVEDEHQARFRLDEVRVLISLSEGLDVDAIAADFLGERPQGLDRGDDLERGRRGPGKQESERAEQGEKFHGPSWTAKAGTSSIWVCAVRGAGDLELQEGGHRILRLQRANAHAGD